jgi:predicted nuclease with TOPRIM domain
VGKQYSREEIDQIQALVAEGCARAQTKESLKSLVYEERALSERISNLRIEVSSLQARRKDVSKVLSMEEQALNSKLESALCRLKDHKPELFSISVEEQLGKIAGLLGRVFSKWLFEGEG